MTSDDLSTSLAQSPSLMTIKKVNFNVTANINDNIV